MADWSIGLSTGCLSDLPLIEALAAIRGAGFHRIEICSLPSHLDYHDRDACVAAARRLAELELDPYSFHAPFAPRIDITALDDAARSEALAEIERALEAAARLGARHFVLHPGPESSELPRAERLDRMERGAESLDRIAARCRALGPRLVLENMLSHLFAGHVRDLLWLLGALASTEVGICLDTGHAQLSGDLRTVAHKLKGHLWMLHANDTRGQFDDHLPPGDGVVDWSDLLRQLREIGFEGALVLEVAGDGDPAEALARAQRGRTHLRRLAHDLRRERVR